MNTMKIYTYKCPNCSAGLEIAKRVTCEYCGQTFFVDGADEAEENPSEKKKKDTRLAVATICMAVLSIIFLLMISLIPYFFSSLAALVLGIRLLKKQRVASWIGIITGSIAIVIFVFSFSMFIRGVGASPDLVFDEASLKNISRFENISESTTISVLEQISEINEVAAVNAINDVNDGLKKPDGYVSAIYFSLYELEPNKIGYEKVIEGGNRLGGCIELFRNEDDAEKRLKHLHKGHYLGSGGHGRIKKVIIRTSDVLSPARQLELADIIVDYIDGM